MKKGLSILLLCATVFFNSGFKNLDNRSFEQVEVVALEEKLVVEMEETKASQTTAEYKEVEVEEKEAQSIAEKLGQYLVIAFHFVFETIVSFVVGMLN